jgi:hypothetical protein
VERRTATCLQGGRFRRASQGGRWALQANLQSTTCIPDDGSWAQTVKFRERLAAGETLDDMLVEAFAVCREAGRASWACGITTCS